MKYVNNILDIFILLYFEKCLSFKLCIKSKNHLNNDQL